VLVLAVALVPLAILARQNPDTNGGETLLVLPFAAVGFVLARRRPGNPLGWPVRTANSAPGWTSLGTKLPTWVDPSQRRTLFTGWFCGTST
jgi:hypothetical protein